MKLRIQYAIAASVVIIGLGGQLAYSLYLQPQVFSKTIVKVQIGSEGIPANSTLSDKELYLSKVPSGQVPDGAFTSIRDLDGKRTTVDLTNGMIMTKSLVDLKEINPGKGEGVYAIPKDAIYGINGTLRANDTVKIELIVPPNMRDTTDKEGLPEVTGTFIAQAKVAYVRTDDNNDVTDTDKGNTNSRLTSTGRVSYPEVILSDSEGEALKDKLEAGYKVWIVRIR